MTPYDLIGLPYRLGANPQQHGAADCLTLAIAVLNYYKIPTPQPKRAWYRRLYRGDTTVFADELSHWGVKTTTPKIGTVALCESERGFGMATYFEEGWIAFKMSEATWSPIGALQVVEYYCHTK